MDCPLAAAIHPRVSVGMDAVGPCDRRSQGKDARVSSDETGSRIPPLQTLLGHASLNTTQIYTHITIDRLRAVHDATHPAKPDILPLPGEAKDSLPQA
jgi:integrase